jgi:hypothetical protein
MLTVVGGESGFLEHGKRLVEYVLSGMQMVVAPEDDEVWALKEKSATNVDLNSGQLEGCESRPSFRQPRYWARFITN